MNRFDIFQNFSANKTKFSDIFYKKKMELEKITEKIKEIALHCGDIMTKHYNDTDLHIETKSAPTDLVTKVDFEVDKFIREQIALHFPDAGIITEEGENIEPRKRGDDEIWFCVDPLDGTANYASSFPHFCVSIGVLDGNHRPLCGVVYDPIYDELFIGTKGKGAYLLTKHCTQKKKLQCNKRIQLSDCVISVVLLSQYAEYCSMMLQKTFPYIKDYRESGSSALDIAYVAAGRIDGYFGYGPHSWDIAAGSIIALESGASITNYDGIEFNKDNLHVPRLGIVCANPTILKQLIEVIKTLDKPSF